MNFTFHTPASQMNAGREAFNALTVDDEPHVLLVGSDIDDEGFASLSESYATDGGTVVIREDVPVSKIRQNVSYVLAKASRKATFAKVTANTPDSPIVAYVARLKPVA